MILTPFEKIRNRVLFFFIIAVIIRLINKSRFEIYSEEIVIGLIVLASCVWSYKNYRIHIEKDKLSLLKVVGNNICVSVNEIKKIELERNNYGNWQWQMIYIYTENKIYEYNISSFMQKSLINAITKFCADNKIILITENYKKRIIDFI